MEKTLLRPARESDVPAVRRLCNEAYAELANLGLNYTATYQDEEKTRERLFKDRSYVYEINGQIVATIAMYVENHFTQKKTAYLGQLAVQPNLKRNNIGNLLMTYCEDVAKAEGFDGVQLDTAQPATHLVDWYLRRGYRIVGEMHWEGKTYDSFIFEKSFE